MQYRYFKILYNINDQLLYLKTKILKKKYSIMIKHIEYEN